MKPAREMDMTRGCLWTQILRFSLPLMISNVLQILFNIADVAVVGRFAGANALGAVGSTSMLVSLFTGFLIGMGSGVNVAVARHLGAKKEKDVGEAVHTAALLCLLIGAAILAIGLISARGFLELLGTKPVLIDDAELYLRIYFWGMPALAIYNFGNAVLSAAGDTRRPLYYLLFSGAVNVVLNLLLVIVFRMDVAGVAIASVISQYLSAVLILRALLASKESFALHPRRIRLHGDKVRFILPMGLAAGLQSAVFAIANLFLQGAVNTQSAAVVSGNSAAANADALIYAILQGFYMACASFMSQNYGARNRKRIWQTYYITTIYSLVAGIVFGAMMVIFAKDYMRLFTTEPDVIQAGAVRLTVMGYASAVAVFMDNTIPASRALGKSVIPMIIVMIGSCLFRVTWVYTVYAHYGTLVSLYLLYPTSFAVSGIAEVIYFAHCYRKLVRPLDEAAPAAEA